MSEQKELEKMQALRAELEAESRSLKEEQKKLETMVLLLEEKIVVEDLQNGNKATKGAISQLEDKLNELESRLNQKSQAPESPAQPKETKTEIMISPEKTEAAPETLEAPKPAEVEAAPEDFEESGVTVTAIDDEALIENQDAKSDKQQDKRKHRFF